MLAETSIKTEFMSLLAFRHRHDALFEGSDMYFIARLKPLTHEINFDKNEILEARWLPIQEYINDPSVTSLNRQVAEMAWKHMNSSGGWQAHELSVTPVLSWDGKTYHKMYYNAGSS